MNALVPLPIAITVADPVHAAMERHRQDLILCGWSCRNVGA
jgi:hypothetical protein